jgi:predicted dehydrogenase
MRLSRRRLLHAASIAPFLSLPAASARMVVGSAERLRVAGIGVGGKGNGDLDQAAQFMQVVGLCDIDEQRLGKKKELYPQAKSFHDYRAMLDAIGKEIDACIISTPDHHHAPAAMRAMALGKHVYVQKPLTHTPREARLMREMAAKRNVCTQMGNQGSALNGVRRAVELVQAGVLGDVKECHVWTNRPFKYWKQAPDLIGRPPEKPVPDSVHWDEWLGPAENRPYAVRADGKPAYHPHDWRGFWAFGTGALGDMACHTANMAFRALKLDAPTMVTAETAEINAETYPAWSTIHYHFPARGGMSPCVLHWYEGAKAGQRVLPPIKLFQGMIKADEKLADSGSLLIGSKGTLFSPNDYGAKFRLFPSADFAGMQTDTPEKGPAGVEKDQDLHMKKEWVDAIKTGKPELASSNFDFAARLTETMLLGNIAVRFAGQTLTWDAKTMSFTNRDASRFVTKSYRKGWEVAGA